MVPSNALGIAESLRDSTTTLRELLGRSELSDEKFRELPAISIHNYKQTSMRRRRFFLCVSYSDSLSETSDFRRFKKRHMRV